MLVMVRSLIEEDVALRKYTADGTEF